MDPKRAIQLEIIINSHVSSSVMFGSYFFELHPSYDNKIDEKCKATQTEVKNEASTQRSRPGRSIEK